VDGRGSIWTRVSLPLASSDCDKAFRLGGNLPEVAEVRAAVIAALAQSRRLSNSRRRRWPPLTADQQGQLDGRTADSGDIEDGSGPVAAMRQDLAARRVMVDAIVEKAESALKRDDWESALMF